MMRKDKEWLWELQHQIAFYVLKECFTTHPLLCIYDSKLPTIVETDASKCAMGVVLLQNNQMMSTGIWSAMEPGIHRNRKKL